MKSSIVTVLILALASICWGADLPSTPTPVEHDPGAWAFTTGTTAATIGIFAKPWIGFAGGVAVAVFPNLQNSNNARQNIVGGIAGAAVGYVIIKTLKKDWHKH